MAAGADNADKKSASAMAAALPRGSGARSIGSTLSPAQRQARMSQAFANIVAVLMRDRAFRQLTLADLEWLVLPPLLAGQYKIGHGLAKMPGSARPPIGPAATKDGAASTSGAPPTSPAALVPVAVALWARVAPQIDAQLSGNLDQQMRLRPNQWTSGDNLWLIAVTGEKASLREFLQQLNQREFKGKPVKLRTAGRNGKVEIKLLSDLATAKS